MDSFEKRRPWRSMEAVDVCAPNIVNTIDDGIETCLSGLPPQFLHLYTNPGTRPCIGIGANEGYGASKSCILGHDDTVSDQNWFDGTELDGIARLCPRDSNCPVKLNRETRVRKNSKEFLCDRDPAEQKSYSCSVKESHSRLKQVIDVPKEIQGKTTKFQK